MTHYIVPWSPLTETGSVILVVVVLVIIGLLLVAAARMRHPLAARRPGLFLGVCLVLMWVVSALAFLMSDFVYGLTLKKQLGGGPITEPANHVTPVTLACGAVSFFVIAFLTANSGRSSGETQPISQSRFWLAVGSAIVGTIAAPLIFELPFDLMVMGRVYSPAPHVLFTLLYFLPLFLVELGSFAMLTFSPFMRVSRLTLFLLAGMFIVFGVWAVFGFTYPSSPLPYACNVTSKILAFAVAVSLFLSREPTQLAPDTPSGDPLREPLPARQNVPSASGLV